MNSINKSQVILFLKNRNFRCYLNIVCLLISIKAAIRNKSAYPKELSIRRNTNQGKSKLMLPKIKFCVFINVLCAPGLHIFPNK